MGRLKTETEHWLEIDLDQVGGEIKVTARGSGGEHPRPHSLGPNTSNTLRIFSEGVKDAAVRAIPLEKLKPAAAASTTLYEDVFREGLQEVLYRLQGLAGAEPVLLRLMLPEPILQLIPWEALRRPDTNLGFLGTSQELYLSRGVHSSRASMPREVRGAVRLLVISPSSETAPHQLHGVLHPRIEAGEIEWLEPLTGQWARPHYVLDRLRREPVPHILHFIGHGALDEAGAPLLRMADSDEEHWLKVELLAGELEGLFRSNLRLVILEACEGARPGVLTSAAEQLAASGADAVVAHLWSVRKDVAQRCSAAFYRSLTMEAASSGDVAQSLHDARRTLLAEFEESAEAFSPVLYLRSRNSILFDIKRRRALSLSSPRSTPTPEDRPSAGVPHASHLSPPAARPLPQYPDNESRVLSQI
jgi:hypothetical protein